MKTASPRSATNTIASTAVAVAAHRNTRQRRRLRGRFWPKIERLVSSGGLTIAGACTDSSMSCTSSPERSAEAESRITGVEAATGGVGTDGATLGAVGVGAL